MFLLLCADHARVHVVHFRAGRAVHPREVIQGGDHAQAIKEFVKPKCGHRLTEDAVLEFCAEHMAGFKLPSHVEIVDDFPRTCSMKIEKKLLK